ncbi:class I SAM-dependent methyltransferase [Actinomadura rifamycini]|nr:class I SAM-dependent methyltransferase [Actinomadura rifamycini]
MPTPEPHRVRAMAESFGEDAERYDRTRPRYPDSLIAAITAASPGPDVLDVGCGTGIEARQFAASGCRLLGVEPDARMAAFARARGLDVEVATFEDWDPAGRTFDAVVAGTAWHWVDPRAGAAKAARVLRPGGRLAAFWNVFALPPEVAAATADACLRVMPDSPIDFRAVARGGVDGYRPILEKTADGIRATTGFGAVEQWVHDWERPYTRDEWLDQMPTQGAFTRLPPDALAQVLDGVGAAIDALGGAFTMRYSAVAVTAPYRPAP